MSPEFTRRRRAAAVVAALAALLVAPPAAGAITLGPGELPGLAVDASGTAYIAWDGPASSLQFCRLPRGATACDSRHAISAAGSSIRRPFVAVSGTRVVVVQFRHPIQNGEPAAGVFAFTSTDGGAAFGAGVRVGVVDFTDTVVGPGDTMSGVTHASPQVGAFQNVPLDGTANNPAVSAQLWGGDHPYHGTVGLIDAATPLAIYATGAGDAQVRRYGGSGDLNDAANWTPAADIGTVNYPHLASGPTGLFLFTTTDNTLVSRKWNGTTFGPGVAISAGVTAPTMHAFQDASARLHVVFMRGGPLGRHLIHAVSDDGTTWRSGTVVATANPVDSFGDTRVATAPDHIGVVAWTGAAAIGGPEVRVAAVGPDAPVDALAPPAPAPPAATPPRVVKRKPNMTASGSAEHAGRKVRVKLKGKLILPAGISTSTGCNGKVKVKIKIARSKKAIATKTVRVATTCRYALRIKLKRSKVKTAKALAVTLRYGGNAVLTPVRKTLKLKVKQAG